ARRAIAPTADWREKPRRAVLGVAHPVAGLSFGRSAWLDLRGRLAFQRLAWRHGGGGALSASAIYGPRHHAMATCLANGSDRLGRLCLPHSHPVRIAPWIGGSDQLFPHTLAPRVGELLLAARRGTIRGGIWPDMRTLLGRCRLDVVAGRRTGPQRAIGAVAA